MTILLARITFSCLSELKVVTNRSSCNNNLTQLILSGDWVVFDAGFFFIVKPGELFEISLTSTTPLILKRYQIMDSAIDFIDSFKNLLRIDFPVLLAGAVIMKKGFKLKTSVGKPV